MPWSILASNGIIAAGVIDAASTRVKVVCVFQTRFAFKISIHSASMLVHKRSPFSWGNQKKLWQYYIRDEKVKFLVKTVLMWLMVLGIYGGAHLYMQTSPNVDIEDEIDNVHHIDDLDAEKGLDKNHVCSFSGVHGDLPGDDDALVTMIVTPKSVSAEANSGAFTHLKNVMWSWKHLSRVSYAPHQSMTL